LRITLSNLLELLVRLFYMMRFGIALIGNRKKQPISPHSDTQRQ
jgi:hypothetical protein